MTMIPALPILDLSSRQTARVRDFRTGSSIWLREDIRLVDGASKVVPAVFQRYDRRRTRCAVVRGPVDAGLARPVWVALDDVVPRHWADDQDPALSRIAWYPPTMVPLDAGPTSLLLAIVSVVVVVAFLGLAAWSLSS